MSQYSGMMNRYRNIIAGSIAFFLFLLQVLAWLHLDRAPVTWDPAKHLTDDHLYFHLLSHPSIDSLKKIIRLSVYPPLVGLSLFIFYLFFGESADKAIIYQNLIFVPLLSITTYLIAKRVSQKKTGVLPILLLLTYPQIFTITNKFLLDIPLTAMVSLSIYGLMCTENFTRPKNSVLLGIMLGMGMLTKQQFSMFLLGPFLILTIFSLKDGYMTGTVKKRSINIIIPLLISLLIASCWYVPNFKQLIIYANWAAIEDGVYRGYPFPFSFQSMQYYLFTLINEQISFVYIVLFLIGLIPFLKRITREKILIISWIVIPYLVLTFLMYQKTSRFLLPALPAFALITSMGLKELSKKYFNMLVIPAVFIALLQLMATNFGLNFVSKDFTISFFNRALILFRGSGSNMPNSMDWELGKMLSAIHQDMESNRELNSKIIIFSNHYIYNPPTLNYYSILNNFDLDIKKERLNRKDLFDLMENDSYKYFIFKTWPNFKYLPEKETYVKGIKFVYSHPGCFKRIFTHNNPDHSFTFIYKRVLPVRDYRYRKEELKNLLSPIKAKVSPSDPSHIKINFEGGIPPYAIELSLLENPEDSFFIGINNVGIEDDNKRLHTVRIARSRIREASGLVMRVVDVLGNVSNPISVKLDCTQ